MAEVAPWLQPSTPAPSGNTAPWLVPKEEGPGVLEDVAKAAPSGLAKGVISVAGTGGDLGAVGKVISDKATEKGLNPFSWLGDKFAQTRLGQFLKDESAKTAAQGGVSAAASGDLPGSYELPTSAGIKGAVEGVTGPLYNAKTPVGKAVETGTGLLPALAMGGGSALGNIAKAAGGGVASEAAGEGAAALKDKLPESVQPWAEPVARAVGAGAGTFLPSVARKAITPLPMSDPQFAAVSALKNEGYPELAKASTAGQLTESPRLMALEARTNRGQNAAGAQEKAYTQGAMREAGIDGTFADIAKGKDIGKDIGNIRSGTSINGQGFVDLKKDVGIARRDLQRVVGKGANTQSADEVSNAIKFGAANNGTPVMSMPGPRYQFMRGDLQRRIDGAGSPEEKMALSKMRDSLDTAFKGAAGPQQAAQLDQLEKQYANYNVLNNIPPRVGKEAVTPQEVLSSVGKNWGNKAANEGRGLAENAQNAGRVMTPHPEVRTDVPPIVDLLMSGATGLLHGGAAHHYGGSGAGIMGLGEGSVLGHLLAPSTYNMAAGAIGKAASSTPAQAYLANQLWRPGAASGTPSKEELVRLLMSPQAQALQGPSQ